MTTVTDDLRNARVEVEAGWCQGLLENDNTVCAVGALNRAVCGNARARGELSWAWERSGAAEKELKNHLPAEFLHVSQYNDAAATTKQDILDLFDKTLADLGAL